MSPFAKSVFCNFDRRWLAIEHHEKPGRARFRLVNRFSSLTRFVLGQVVSECPLQPSLAHREFFSCWFANACCEPVRWDVACPEARVSLDDVPV